MLSADTEAVANQIIESFGYDADTTDKGDLSDNEREFLDLRLEAVERHRDELQSAMDDLADEHGEPITRQKMDRHGRFSASTYRNFFGGWSAAVEACGYVPVESGPTAVA